MNKIILCSALLVAAFACGAHAQTQTLTVPLLNPTVIQAKNVPAVSAMPALSAKPVIDQHLVAPAPTAAGVWSATKTSPTVKTNTIAPKLAPIMLSPESVSRDIQQSPK